MAERARLRVFEDSTGYRFVKQLTQAECDAYLADNPDLTLIR
jgi:hypothetical protein